MSLGRLLRNSLRFSQFTNRSFCQEKSTKESPAKFETVFSFPTVKYFAIINRLKLYQIVGTAVAIPACGALEMASLVPEYSILTTTYIGLTGAALLCLSTLPFRNIIGFIYVSEDNEYVKISSINYWGKRIDKIIKVDEWIPLYDMPAKTMDAIYLTPRLADGTVYKLFIKFGIVINKTKMGQVLE